MCHSLKVFHAKLIKDECPVIPTSWINSSIKLFGQYESKLMQPMSAEILRNVIPQLTQSILYDTSNYTFMIALCKGSIDRRPLAFWNTEMHTNCQIHREVEDICDPFAVPN